MLPFFSFAMYFNFFKKKNTVLFHRDYLRFQGGHLKVFHYFSHLQATDIYQSRVYFTPTSVQDNSNPWQKIKSLNVWQPETADILFLAGLDWGAVLNHPAYLARKDKIPVINLIQGLSHADPKDLKFKFLRERAIRICVSQQVTDAIQATGQVNGPIFTIPNGIDLSSLPQVLDDAKKNIDLLIVAIKKPQLGLDLEQQLKNKYVTIKTIGSLLPRAEFLSLLNQAKQVLCLPHVAEGFYLPALEAMALGAIVICPDCIGNRSFCLDQHTCLLPNYEIKDILQALDRANALTEQQRQMMIKNAKQQIQMHSLEQEAQQFLAIMRDLPSLW
ncbi:MAG: glycosyltransferase family 4 protein [Thiolinea sp.]